MRLGIKDRCPIHNSYSCCGREQYWAHKSLGTPVRRVDDPHHPRGYRELRSPAAMRVIVNQKISEQNGCCAICGKSFQDYAEVVPDHSRPRGMGAGFRDDHPDNIAAVHRLCNLEKGSRHNLPEPTFAQKVDQRIDQDGQCPQEKEDHKRPLRTDEVSSRSSTAPRTLSRTQRALLASLHHIYQRTGICPTYRELTALVGVSSPAAVGYNIAVLENLGLVTRSLLRRKRNIFLTDSGKAILCALSDTQSDSTEGVIQNPAPTDPKPIPLSNCRSIPAMR